jgi:hypothetical protein
MWRWFFKPAKWYQFWLPQSGLSGGLFCGCVIVAVIVLAERL